MDARNARRLPMRELTRKPEPEENGKDFSEYILLLVLVSLVVMTVIIA